MGVAHRVLIQILVLAGGLSTLGTEGFARPEWVLARDVPGLSGKPRKNMVVITNQGTAQKPDFRLHLPGIVPLNDNHQMKWFKDDSWKTEPTAVMDQILLDDSHYGPVSTRSLNLEGCAPREGLRVHSRSKPLEAFLVYCDDSVVTKIPWPQPAVGFDLTRGFLESKRYHYKFQPKNHMLFETIQLKGADGSVTELAKESDLLIRADVRNFFTMQFDSSDIVSKMKSHRAEPVGAFATLGFYLNILFFKISLDLDTDVRFFGSSSHIPMTLTVPVNAKKRLHEKSGVLYSFILGPSVPGPKEIDMPFLKGSPAPASHGLQFCQGSECRYRLTFETTESPPKALAMELNLPRTLVELGMFPHYVDDVVAQSKDMKWALTKSQKAQKRVGLYLEVSGLPEGEHKWDFWMELGK